MKIKPLLRSLLAACGVVLLGASLASAKTHHHATKAGSAGKAAHQRASHKKAFGKRVGVKATAPCKSKKCRKVSHKGQQKIDSTRATQIQQELVKAGYLHGEPTGVWDADSQAAMVRYQGDNGWQTKVTPDSRALIKLGLGPSHEGLINPETAMTALPERAAAKSGLDAPQR